MKRSSTRWLVAAGLILAAIPSLAGAQRAPGGLRELSPPANVLPKQLETVDVEEHLGEMLPLDVKLKDHTGKDVLLGDYFQSGRPVIVNLVYYGCPMLCGLVLNGVAKTIGELQYLPGKEFEVVTVSIDPKETTDLAAKKRDTILELANRTDFGTGWNFHTAEEGEVQRLADALGFKYHWVEKEQTWAHPAAIFVASPEGKISRYLYGIEFPASNLKLALLDASKGKVGSTIDKLLLFCYHFDDDSKEYVLFAQRLMRYGGALTLVCLGAFLFINWRRSSLRKS
ncbi:SCO family protein [Vulgatibacter incomptus]|uniref:Thioredoxin domain-containing protein n=1 Tax=Vulgatibacter incomptus TaxID=1391653 RepID=A0A0K1PH00_9BACT|nr:SCO family protein [Vulgatibacter incomptus]AKU92808.1 hypothetical protein AKJ08_3195 [Vulgatibacter incomptus]